MPGKNTEDPAPFNWSFLLLVHVICADEQIHSQEAKALRDLAAQANIDSLTMQAAEKILGQDENYLCFEAVVHHIPVDQRNEVLRQVLAIAYVDGFFSPLEREMVNHITQLWGIHPSEVDQMLQSAQGFGQSQPDEADDRSDLSIGAQLLKGAESLLSRSLVSKLAELAPESVGRKIERLQREILLAGPEYDAAIQRCAKIAREDYKYAETSLRKAYVILQDLGNGLQQVITDIYQKTKGKGNQATAKDVAEQLKSTQKALSAEILHDLETVRESLRAKQRALNHFSIAFMGKTKAGKSTLHAVVTGEGWEAIGVGKQRTTRYNRVYEWKNIRIIDTPGIGAPGGKTDEEIARSVIEEADVICYVVIDDSIQETEFQFLKVLKEKTKPLIVLLNLKQNLRDQRRLDHFLKNPDRLFALEGQSGIGGHLERIRRYAKEHYPNDYLDVIPVMLLAAQLAQESAHQSHAKQLFQASRIQDFLDAIRISLIEYGAIRRSQTLLGSTVGAIDNPRQWTFKQGTSYQDLAEKLGKKQQEFKTKLQQAEQDAGYQLTQRIKAVFREALNAIPTFAEEHWQDDECAMERGWKQQLQSIKFEENLKIAFEEASHNFQREVQAALEEIGNELNLIAQLKGGKFQFSKQDTDDVGRQVVKFGGTILSIVCLALIPVMPALAPVLGIAGLVLGLGSQLSNFFKSREQKRREAVQNISASLQKQLEDQQGKILQQAQTEFGQSCQSLAKTLDLYFADLVQGIQGIATQLEKAQAKLTDCEQYLNGAYAKRIVDWATDQHEALTDMAIRKTIRKVNRIFGQQMQIAATSNFPLKKTPDQIRKILQENVSIQLHKN